MINSLRAKTVWHLAALALVVLCLTPARAERRVALVIGNSSYLHVPRLDNPANDANLMAKALKSVGFDLVGGGPQLDLDKHHLDSIVQKFGHATQGADVALFYYAGHGMQANGSNYLVPVDANPVRQADVAFQMLNASLLLQELEESGTKLNVVILDACRNNPFAGSRFRAMNRGLGQMRAPEGTVISYATQPGAVAQDGTDGHSPYTEALAAAIRRPSLHIFQTFNQVGLAVKRATGGKQEPWLAISPLEGSFSFAPTSVPAKSGAVVASLDTAPKDVPSVKTAPQEVPSQARSPSRGFTPQDLEKVRSIARSHKFLLPSFSFTVPDRNISGALLKFVGVWATEVGWNGGGRKVMLIVTNVDPQGQASGIFVWGPPTPAMPARLRKIPAGFRYFESKIVGNQFKIHAKSYFIVAKLAPDGSLSLIMKGRADGRTLFNTAAPVWRAIASR